MLDDGHGVLAGYGNTGRGITMMRADPDPCVAIAVNLGAGA